MANYEKQVEQEAAHPIPISLYNCYRTVRHEKCSVAMPIDIIASERADLVVSRARFFAIYIVGERERANLVVQLARFFGIFMSIRIRALHIP